MTFDFVCSVLCNEPYNLTVAEIARLTPRQVRLFYFCERDDKGRVKIPRPKQKTAPPSIADLQRRQFDLYWRKRGLRKDQRDRLWDNLH